MPRKRKSKPALPRMQKGAAIYEDGLKSEPKGRRAALQANQARAIRRIGDDSQGPQSRSGDQLKSEDLS